MDWPLNTSLVLKTFWFPILLGIILLIMALVVWRRAGRIPNTEKKQEMSIQITDGARDKIKELKHTWEMQIKTSDIYVRVEVGDGYCGKLKYSLYWEAEKLASDIEFEANGIKILISKDDQSLLGDITIDYVADGGFYIENSGIRSECGCASVHTH